MGDVDVEGERAVSAPGNPGRLGAGTEIGGYTIRRLLGKGAMGAVYEAVDDGGQAVALKLLHAHLDTDQVARERLRREVAALQRLRHPAVARVLDAELDGEGAFIVTELVPGRTLEDEVDDGGPLDAVDLYELADQLAAALEAVHLAGVVHRDLKPSNVMVTPHGPVLIDFGISQAAGDAAQPGLTSPGFVIGTPGYLAPELLDGGTASPDSDWWSWAALLAFAATGRSPFGVRPTELVLRRSREGRADLVGVSARTARALAGALQADRTVRWGPTEVARALRRDSQDASLAALDSDAPDDDGATQRIAVHPDGGTSGAATLAAGVPTQLVAPMPIPSIPPDHDRDSAHDGHTRAVPVTTGAVPTVTGGVPVVTGAIPTGEVRYQSFDSHAGGEGAADEQDETPPAPYTRPERARRTGTVLAFLLPLMALAATRPGIAFVVLGVLVILARIAGHSSRSLHDRRERHGTRRRSDGVVAAVAFPWHVVVGALGSIAQLVVAGCVGLLAVVGGFWLFGAGRLIVMPRTDIAARSVGGMNAEIVFCALLALTMLITAVVAWFGPAGLTGREGARALLHTVAPGWIGAAVVIAACIIVAWVLARPLLEVPPIIHWWPASGPPHF